MIGMGKTSVIGLDSLDEEKKGDFLKSDINKCDIFFLDLGNSTYTLSVTLNNPQKHT